MRLIAAMIHLTLVNLLITLCDALEMHAYDSCPGHVSIYVSSGKCGCGCAYDHNIQYIESYCAKCHKSNEEPATTCPTVREALKLKPLSPIKKICSASGVKGLASGST
ncbi:uncharacterized protein PGTG_03548 [Puccinia graminis f. sp. tritici CRL 75-36-700-3]|uniref:Uncharacterized protein n=1 Tax=Puccinia graminis f. sp. tritici (strain CRL 75-36-700-3 / race SCCL) TaxID=418459 RepID=E3JZW7_PUCGT|nr:uncharacterized protein PGTG_03548 [Puccinia graminis f. sp. tritici CRL 75-36-700-3]EFP77592.1 hypothetical protein PGTG_03548 [Puccinia graminis f. sp. tritici CRL 75-36-700-3]